jgi:hypothetical protein
VVCPSAVEIGIVGIKPTIGLRSVNQELFPYHTPRYGWTNGRTVKDAVLFYL